MSKLPRTVFRPLDGILLLDKPPGMSSNQALQRVRHLFRAEKAGHTGSLDPLATGLLPDQSAAGVKALKALAPELRFQLARAVRMRHVPELHFHYDDSVDKGERIDALLREDKPSEE